MAPGQDLQRELTSKGEVRALELHFTAYPVGRPQSTRKLVRECQGLEGWGSTSWRPIPCHADSDHASQAKAFMKTGIQHDRLREAWTNANKPWVFLSMGPGSGCLNKLSSTLRMRICKKKPPRLPGCRPIMPAAYIQERFYAFIQRL